MEEKTPQQQVKEAIWTYTGWAMIILACIGAGVFIGYELWGDAPALRLEIDRLDKQVQDLKNTRESLTTQVAMATRDRDECRTNLQKASQASSQQAAGQPPPPAPGAAGVMVEGAPGGGAPAPGGAPAAPATTGGAAPPPGGSAAGGAAPAPGGAAPRNP